MSKLTEMLEKYKDGGPSRMKVGIMGDKTYPDGQKLSFVGYVNEYGYNGIIPGRKQSIFHAVDKDGNMKFDGQFVKKAKSNFERIVDVPEYKLVIPSRPFFRSAIAKNSEELKEIIAKAVKKGGVEYALRIAGEFMTDKLKDSVMTWTDPPNAKSTIRDKGYNAPLRGKDKLLRNSFSYEIEE